MAYKNLSTSASFTGAEELSELLKGLEGSVRADILAPAVEKAAKPIQTAMKGLAPRRTGALAASIAIKAIRDDNKGTASALIGPDRNYYAGSKRLSNSDDRRGSERPANYAHLVEFGHVIAKGGNLRDKHSRVLVGIGKFSDNGNELKRWKRGAVVEKAKGTAGGVVRPKPFVRPGMVAGTPAALAILGEEIVRSIEKTREKYIKAGNHKA